MQINVLEYFNNATLSGYNDRIAIIDRDRTVTFGELEDSAKRCSVSILNQLRVLDSPSLLGQPIAICLPKGFETIVINLGIAFSGNVFTNLDIKSPNKRLMSILNHLEIEFVVTDLDGRNRLLKSGWPEKRLLLFEHALDNSTVYSVNQIEKQLALVIDTDPFCIINTSGSTGTPKGVAISHRGVIDFTDWVTKTLGLNGKDVIGSLSPFFFDIYLMELHVCLATGSTIVILPTEMAMFPINLLEQMLENDVSFIFWVPTIMVNIANMKLLNDVDMTPLKKIFFAGEVFPMKQLNYWRNQLPDTAFVNLYGPIEITVDCTYYVLDREFKDSDLLPIGYPCRNSDILILNEANKLATTNEHGELCVRGSSLALGYWNDPKKTSAAFVQNPLNHRYPETIYRTGDIVFKDNEGLIMYVGRTDLQIKHLGYRIDMGEIEHLLVSQKGVDNACVVYDKKQKTIIAIYESKIDLSVSHLSKCLMNALPKYMVPKIYHHVNKMPCNPNGKIDRQYIRDQFLSSAR